MYPFGVQRAFYCTSRLAIFMQNIVERMNDFQSKVFPYLQQRFQQLAEGQQPHTLFITCCDSRVVPNMVAMAEPGEIFVCRTIGNIVPSHGSEERSVASAIEYATGVLKISNIVVLGHSDCGAMKGLLHLEQLQSLPDTRAWLKHAEKAREAVVSRARPQSERALLENLIQENVLLQVENVKTHPSVAINHISVHGFVFEIGTGSIRRAQRDHLAQERGAA